MKNLKNFSTTGPIFDLKMSLDRAHYDLKLCHAGYPLEAVSRSIIFFFEIYIKFHDFSLKSSFCRNLSEEFQAPKTNFKKVFT